MSLQVVEIAATEEKGGCKFASATISGQGVYGRLKFESGIHRVQRVPATEASGRLHTSAASVAILPQADEVTALCPSDPWQWISAHVQLGMREANPAFPAQAVWSFIADMQHALLQACGPKPINLLLPSACFQLWHTEPAQLCFY